MNAVCQRGLIPMKPIEKLKNLITGRKDDSVSPLLKTDTPEGPPERRTSDEMIEQMMESVTGSLSRQEEASSGPEDGDPAPCAYVDCLADDEEVNRLIEYMK